MKEHSLNLECFNAAVSAMPLSKLAAHRSRAAKLFSAKGFPTTQDENWKYTNLAAAAKISNDWLSELSRSDSTGEAKPSIDTHLDLIKDVDATWLIVRNGLLDAEHFASLPTTPGLHIRRLSDDAECADIIADDTMSALNVALLEDGINICVDDGVNVEKPLGILVIDDARQRVSQGRVVFSIGKNASLRVIDCEMSAGNESQFTNTVVQIDISAGARLDYLNLQNRSLNHIGTKRLVADLGKDAAFRHDSFAFGGSLIRNDIVARINEAGASVCLRGLYLAAGKQHIDNHTRVEHRVGPATSHETYRGILNDQSRCVFNGQAVVFEGADGTDANQENHNLLLSDQAEVDTKPELEIYADDVKCSHGATVGQLDDDSLFYLRSRGLTEAEARRTLIRAFAADLLTSLVIEDAHDVLQTMLDENLDRILHERAL